MGPNPKGQAIVCFVLVPIGLLRVIVDIEHHDALLAIVFTAVTLGTLALGVWLWRQSLP